MPSVLKEAILAIEELEAASIKPDCFVVVTGNDNLGMKVFNILDSQPGKKKETL